MIMPHTKKKLKNETIVIIVLKQNKSVTSCSDIDKNKPPVVPYITYCMFNYVQYIVLDNDNK